jgi:hypothetical protein
MNDTIKTIGTLAVGAALLAGGQAVTPDEFDCKGTDCKVQVLVNEPNFKDAIYYKPDEWNEKTAEEIASEKQERYEKWKTFVEEQSKLETNEVQ